MKPTLAFLARPKHQKTGSDRFLIELLQQHFDVQVLMREALPRKELISQVNQLRPDVLLFYQLPPSATKHLLRMKAKQYIWVPMWDGFRSLTISKRIAYRWRNLRVISFCQRVHEHVQQAGLNSLSVQYFPEPQNPTLAAKGPPYTLFFWQRDPHMRLDLIVNHFPKGHLRKIIIQKDFSHPSPSLPSDIEIEECHTWLSKEDYRKKVEEADFYVAPRFAEGIGFSFLEALAQGKVILAYNEATMNEYIEDGKTGYLFNDKFQFSHELQAPEAILPALKHYCEQGYQRWQQSQKDIIEFLKRQG